MPTQLTDPSVTLPSFQRELDAGGIQIHPCTLDKTLLHHFDAPNGEPRMTYVRLNEHKQVTVQIQFIQTQPYEDCKCFAVAWAVPPQFRGQSRAGEAFLAAVRELRHAFLAQPRGGAFYVEGVIAVENIASRRTAEKVFASAGVHGTDKRANVAIMQYLRRIESNTELESPQKAA